MQKVLVNTFPSSPLLLCSLNNISTSHSIHLIYGYCFLSTSDLTQWRIEAYKGNAIAAQNVGVALYKGELGVEKDEVEACKFFRMASQAGLSTSMFNLGWAYTSGTTLFPPFQLTLPCTLEL